MPTFIDMSNLTKRSTLTGNEEFQVSATEKVTATQIANKVQLNQVLMSGFEAVSIKGVEKIKDTNSLLGALKILYSLSGNGRAKVIGNSENCFGLVSINTAGTLAFGILFDIRSSTPPSIFIRDGFGLTGGASLKDLTDDQWIVEMKKGKKIPMESDIRVVEITDFAIPSVNITKDGQSFLFYANDASNIPNSNHGATSFVGVAIASPIFITGDQRLLYYMMVDTAKAVFYTGYANLEDDVVTWSDTPVTRLGQAVQVTAFTEGPLSALLYSYKPGDFIPFYTGNVTASTTNQFPESGIFNGFISMGSNEGDYFQIFAFKSGSTKAYLGACIGSTTQWTALGGGGTAEPIVVADAESVATVVATAFPKFECGKMLPIYIDPGSDIYDYISITASHITVEESTVCGYAQCVYDGGDYCYIGVDLLVYPGGGTVPLYRAQMVINNGGEVVDSSTFPLGMHTAPIPGYTKVNGGYIDCSLCNDSVTVASLTRSVPANTTCFIEADVQTSVTGGMVKTSSALMFFRLASGSTMCDINSRALGGANEGQVKLNVATINSQTSFVIVTTTYGLDSDVSGGIIRIRNIYAKL
jgi:hypothetical protein